MVVNTSTDHGGTWSSPTLVATSQDPLISLDKPTILADPERPGRAVVAWVEYRSSAPGRASSVDSAWSSRTTDGGRRWSAPVLVYGAGDETQFHQLALLADGTLLDAFVEPASLSGRLVPRIQARIAVARSVDGGRSWTPPVTAVRFPYTVVRDPTGQATVRAAGLTIGLAADRAGAVYLAWSEDHLGGTSTISVARSDDAGLTWSEPAAAVSQPAQAFLPALAVSGGGGVGLLYDAFAAGGSTPVPSPGAAPLPTEVWLAWSKDRGSTWRRSRVGGPFDLHAANLSREGDFVGDYQGLAGSARGFVAVFAMATPLSQGGPTDVFAEVIGEP